MTSPRKGTADVPPEVASGFMRSLAIGLSFLRESGPPPGS